MAHPDEICGVCGTTREMHGDTKHEFNSEGVLIQKKPPEPAKVAPPAERGSADAVKASFAMLIEILAEKGILVSSDIIRIFSARP